MKFSQKHIFYATQYGRESFNLMLCPSKSSAALMPPVVVGKEVCEALLKNVKTKLFEFE